MLSLVQFALDPKRKMVWFSSRGASGTYIYLLGVRLKSSDYSGNVDVLVTTYTAGAGNAAAILRLAQNTPLMKRSLVVVGDNVILGSPYDGICVFKPNMSDIENSMARIIDSRRMSELFTIHTRGKLAFGGDQRQ